MRQCLPSQRGEAVTSCIVLLSTIWARFSVSFLLRSDSDELVTLGATAPHVLPYAVFDSR
jgi:hypothetical protein